MVDRYYNSWIENTDQVAEDDASSMVSAEASNRPEVEPYSSDHVPVDAGRKSADGELSDWNVSATPSVDDDDDDDSDVFPSFM